jgi:hypothetical protein
MDKIWVFEPTCNSGFDFFLAISMQEKNEGYGRGAV